MTSDLTVDQPGPPPLRIHHFMACATIAAIQLSLWRARFQEFTTDAATLPTGYRVVMTAYESLTAMATTVAIFSIYWRYKKLIPFLQPGQWLLVGYAIVAIPYNCWLLIQIAIFGPSWRYVFSPSQSSPALSLLSSIGTWLFMLIIPVAFNIWCAWRIADTRPWKWVFVTTAISQLLESSVAFWLVYSILGSSGIPYSILYFACAIIQVAAGLWAVSTDMRAKRPRWWPHWVGIGIAILIHTTSILYFGLITLINGLS